MSGAGLPKEWGEVPMSGAGLSRGRFSTGRGERSRMCRTFFTLKAVVQTFLQNYFFLSGKSFIFARY